MACCVACVLLGAWPVECVLLGAWPVVVYVSCWEHGLLSVECVLLVWPVEFVPLSVVCCVECVLSVERVFCFELKCRGPCGRGTDAPTRCLQVQEQGRAVPSQEAQPV